MKFSKDQYILRNFSKIQHKQWELYIITRIVHNLNDPEIEFVCQQLIKTKDGKRYLADLCFPSLSWSFLRAQSCGGPGMTVAGLASLASTVRVSPVLVSSSTIRFKKSARRMHPVATSGQIASAAMAFSVAFERAAAAEAVPSSRTARIYQAQLRHGSMIKTLASLAIALVLACFMSAVRKNWQLASVLQPLASPTKRTPSPRTSLWCM